MEFLTKWSETKEQRSTFVVYKALTRKKKGMNQTKYLTTIIYDMWWLKLFNNPKRLRRIYEICPPFFIFL